MVKPAQKRPYHHGDLREALLDVVGAMVEEGGIESVSVRGAARRVGVSHPAAFRHFKDKKGLFTAFATRAASHLADALDASEGPTGDDPAFLSVGVSYLKFAMEHPGEFRMIFREDLLDRTDDQYQAQIARLALSLSGSGAAIEPGKALPPEALLAWSATHGLALLYLDGTLGKELPEGQELTAMKNVLRLLARPANYQP